MTQPNGSSGQRLRPLRPWKRLKSDNESVDALQDWWQRWGARVTLLSAIAGGIGAAFKFWYTQWYLPNSKPGLVQVEVIKRYVGETLCCRVFEVITTFENKSGREVVLHASHQTIGARKQTGVFQPGDDGARWDATNAFNHSRTPGQPNFTYINDHNAQYVSVSLDKISLLLAAGNPAGPGGYLSDGEKHVHVVVAQIPKDYTVFSVRGLMHIANASPYEASFWSSFLDAEKIHWHWVVDPFTLRPKSIPWREDDALGYTKLSRCLSEPACERKFREETYRLQEKYKQNDKRNFSVTWAADFASVEKGPVIDK